MQAEPPTCPACGSTRSRHAFDVREFRFRRCGSCATLFVERADGAQDLYAGVEYFANPDFGSPERGGYHGYRDYLADRAHIEEKFAEVLAVIERYVSPGTLLDVGAGPGFLLAAARGRGWDGVGLDLNEWAAAYARETVGVDVRTGSLETAELDAARFDAVTMMDLVEHVPHLDPLLGAARRVTRPGGVLAVLTPDAGSVVSRALGKRWPEVQRAPEHLALYSRRGLAEALRRHDFEPLAWHSVGKTTTFATLLADVSPVAPRVGRAVQAALAERPFLSRTVELDPHTKFVVYARRRTTAREEDDAVFEDLQKLAQARRLTDWIAAQVTPHVRGDVVEVGAGIGTYSERILTAGAESLTLVEPEQGLADSLERRFAGEPRVRVVRESLPDAPSLAPDSVDLAVALNVLEHVDDDGAAVAELARTLRPGGRLVALVPAHPRLFGSLDDAYGHRRRYTPQRLRALAENAGLVADRVQHLNALGILGWLASGATGARRIDARALRAYEALVAVWRPLEERLRPPLGLSLVLVARRP